MAVEVQEVPDDKVVEETISGKLTKSDYGHSVPIVEAAIQRCGEIRLLVVIHEFRGWTAGALWEDVNFDCGQWPRVLTH